MLLKRGMGRLGDQELLVILNRARTLLSDPSRWSDQHYAEDESGRWIPVGSSQAARFNLEGALMHAAGRDAREAIAAIFDVFAVTAPQELERLKRRPSSTLTHAEAIALLDQAMRQLSEPPVRKQSGVHPITVLPDGEEMPEEAKTKRG